MKLLPNLLCSVLLLLAGSAGSAWAMELNDVHAAINLAGRQRMLSQRIAKSYLQIGQGIDPEGSRRALKTSQESFERQLAELRRYAPNDRIRADYIELERVWAEYKRALDAGPPTRKGAERVLRLADDALAITQRATTQLEALSASRTGRVLNLSGRQRMLSQRLALLFLAQTWELGDTSSGIAAARAEFQATLLELQAVSAHTGTLKAGLELVDRQWSFYDRALTHAELDPRTRAVSVAAASDRILETMEVAVSLYEPRR